MNAEPALFQRSPRCLWAAVLLGAISLLALALRLPSIGESLWLDELHTAWVVDGGLHQMHYRAAMGNTSPLYFLFPWASTQIFGLNEVALRLPSLIAGVLLVPAVYWLVVRWTGSCTGSLLAGFLVAIDHNCVYFSHEARAYVLVQLVAVFQVAAFSSACEGKTRWRPILVSLSVAMFYLHYTSALLLLAESVYYLLALSLPQLQLRYRLRSALLDAGIVAALCSASLPHLRAIAAHRGDWQMFVPQPGFFDVVILFPTHISGTAVLLLLSVMAARQPPGNVTRIRFLQKLPQVLLTCCWAMIPLLIASIASRLDIARLFMRRYLMASEVAAMVILGLICGLTGSRRARYASAIIIGGLVFGAEATGPGGLTGFTREIRLGIRGDQDWRGAVDEINAADAFRGWPVLLRSGLIEAKHLTSDRDPALVQYSLLPVGSIYRIDASHPLVPLATTRPQDLQDGEIAMLEKQPGAWLLTPGGNQTKQAVVTLLQSKLRSVGISANVDGERNFGQLWLLRLKFQP